MVMGGTTGALHNMTCYMFIQWVSESEREREREWEWVSERERQRERVRGGWREAEEWDNLYSSMWIKKEIKLSRMCNANIHSGASWYVATLTHLQYNIVYLHFTTIILTYPVSLVGTEQSSVMSLLHHYERYTRLIAFLHAVYDMLMLGTMMLLTTVYRPPSWLQLSERDREMRNREGEMRKKNEQMNE